MAEALDMPRERWLVKGLIAEGRLSIWFGPPGCGKSFLMGHVSACIAMGQEVFGRRVKQGHAVYVAAEGAGGLRLRLAALVQEGVLDRQSDFGLITVALDLASDFRDTERLLTALEPYGRPALVVIDTVARSIGGADEDAEAFGHLIRAADRIRHETGAHVALVHHVGKDLSRGPRGHSSLLGAVDTAIEVSKGEDGDRTATVVKQRDGEEGHWLTFRLKSIEVGRDEDGDPETSCLVTADGAGAKGIVMKRPRRPGGQAGIALEALEDLFAKGAAEPAAYAADIPMGASVVRVARWRDAALGWGLCETGASKDTRRKAFHRAKVWLVNHCWVACREIDGVEFVWLTGHVRDMSGTCDGDSGGTDTDKTLRVVPYVPGAGAIDDETGSDHPGDNFAS